MASVYAKKDIKIGYDGIKIVNQLFSPFVFHITYKP